VSNTKHCESSKVYNIISGVFRNLEWGRRRNILFGLRPNGQPKNFYDPVFRSPRSPVKPKMGGRTTGPLKICLLPYHPVQKKISRFEGAYSRTPPKYATEYYIICSSCSCPSIGKIIMEPNRLWLSVSTELCSNVYLLAKNVKEI
jgi:hypothetical protein